MYNWYAEADICIAYLFDVQVHQGLTAFKASEWFKRGWTLQELIAPSTVLFLDKDWHTIGHKSGSERDSDDSPSGILGRQLNDRIAEYTGIPLGVLHDPAELDSLSVDVRLSWMDTRHTTKIEDQAYCLLGIFNIYIPLIYGERQQASRRLFDEILRRQVWLARGVGNSNDTDNNDAPSEIADRAHTSQDNLSHIMKVLQDRISKLEMEHNKIQRARIARRRAGPSNADSFNTMLQQFHELQQRTMTENLMMQKAHAFWNPLESMDPRDATS